MAKVVSLALALGLFSTVTGQGNVVCVCVCVRGGEGARKCICGRRFVLCRSTSQGNTLTLYLAMAVEQSKQHYCPAFFVSEFIRNGGCISDNRYGLLVSYVHMLLGMAKPINFYTLPPHVFKKYTCYVVVLYLRHNNIMDSAFLCHNMCYCYKLV